MKYLSFVVLFVCLLANGGWAQKSYSINMSSGRLVVNEVDRVTFTGNSSGKVVIETEGADNKENERAEGLREISASGLADNTGIGLSVRSNNGEKVISQVSRQSKQRYLIKVPAGVSVYYEHSTYHGKDIKLEDIASEVEISANYNSVNIKNASGPLTINSVYGHIEADFDQLQENVILHSVYDHVDIRLPASAKANVRLSTSYGKMYTDLDLETNTKEGMRNISSNRITGLLNGGGVDLQLKATYDNIYLRKR